MKAILQLQVVAGNTGGVASQLSTPSVKVTVPIGAGTLAGAVVSTVAEKVTASFTTDVATEEVKLPIDG